MGGRSRAARCTQAGWLADSPGDSICTVEDETDESLPALCIVSLRGVRSFPVIQRLFIPVSSDDQGSILPIRNALAVMDERIPVCVVTMNHVLLRRTLRVCTLLTLVGHGGC